MLLNHSPSSSSFEPVVLATACPHWISGQVLSRQLNVSSSKSVRSCSPWGDQWTGHWRTKWSTVYSSAPHSQAAEEAMAHLHEQERKNQTPAFRRLSRTQVLLGRIAQRVSGSVTKCGVLWGCPPTLHSIGDPPSVPTCVVIVRWTDDLLCCGYKCVSRFESCIKSRLSFCCFENAPTS